MGNPAESSMSGVRTTTRRVFGFWPFGSRTSAKRMSAKRIGYGAAVVPPLFILVYPRGRRLIVVGLGKSFIDRPPAPLYFGKLFGLVRRLLGQSIQPILDRLDDVRLEYLDR